MIPPSICEDLKRAPRVIEYLQEVNLSHNKFSRLPDEFFLLINLKILNLDHNLLVEFPKKLLSFYRLEELYLGHNNIKHLPWGMNRLKKLKVLHLQSNKIDYIPNTIGKLNNLVDLNIIPNPLEFLNDQNVLLACHNGHIGTVLAYLLYQEVPNGYPFEDDVKALKKSKKRKTTGFH